MMAIAVSPALFAAETVKSPDGNLIVNVDILDGGIPVYTVDYKGKRVVNPSR